MALGGGTGVGGGGDWPADDRKSARRDGFGRRGGPSLSSSLLPRLFFRADAGSDDQEIATAGFADSRGLL